MRYLLMLPVVALIFSAAATAQAGPGTLSVRTGVTGSHSAVRVVSDHPHHVLVAEARVLTHGPYDAFVVEIGQRLDGVHAQLRMRRATSYGRVLEFHPAERRERFCTGNGVCNGWRTGTVILSREAFAAAAGRGLSMRVEGPDGAIDLALPPALFSEAWGLAHWLD